MGSVGVADDLVTGEAVALELPAAGVGRGSARSRSTRRGRRPVVPAVGGHAVAVWRDRWLGRGPRLDRDAARRVLALLVLPTTLETLTRGRSLGKLALGLRTVRDDAGPIGFRHAFTRALVGVVEIWLLSAMPALVSGWSAARASAWATTRPGPTSSASAARDHLPPPPADATGARRPGPSGADIAPLPDSLAAAMRQFLVRAAGPSRPTSARSWRTGCSPRPAPTWPRPRRPATTRSWCSWP